MPGEIDTLRVKIESSSDKARTNIKYLVVALNDLRKIADPTAQSLHYVNSELREMWGTLKGFKTMGDPFRGFSEGARKASQRARDLGEAMRKAYGSTDNAENAFVVPFQNGMGAIDAYIAKVHEAQDLFRGMQSQARIGSAGGSTPLLEDFNIRDNNIIDGKLVGEQVIQFNDKIFESTNNLNVANEVIYNMVQSFKMLAQEAGKFALKVGGIILPVLAKVGSLLAGGVIKGIRAVGSAASRSIGKVKAFFSSIVRIAKYRAIRSALRAITQGFSTGLENLYRFSQAYNTDFAPKMDRLATSMLYLKNGFAAMFSPLIEYFTPFIEQLVDKLVNAFNWVQKLFAQLTGKKTWNKAVKVQTKYKEATQDTADSVKELRQELQLMDFDELNNITESPDNGSKAKDKKAEEPDPTKMFTIEEVENPMEGTFWENVKKKFFEWLGDHGWLDENGNINWGAIGESIGSKIKEWFDKIDWGAVWNTIKKIAAAVWQLAVGILRGLFPKLFAALDRYNAEMKKNDAAEEAGRQHAYEARENSRNIDQWIAQSLGEFNDSYEGYYKAAAMLGDMQRSITEQIKDLYTDPRTGGDRKNLYESLYENRNTLAGNGIYEEQKINDKDFEAYANYREQLEKLSGAFETLNGEMDKAYSATSGNNRRGLSGAITDFFDGLAESINEPGPAETWANSIKDNLSTIEESGVMAGSAFGKWFGNSASEEAKKKLLGELPRELQRNPVTLPIKLRMSVVKTLNANAQGANGLPTKYNSSSLDTVRDAVLPGGVSNIWSNIKRVLGFAEGGYPSAGTMFVAGEAGAEMVGNINGRTGVASGQEITGIGDAVWSTGNTTANILTEILEALREKELTITPSSALGKVVARSQKLYQAQMG